jgi:NADH dehydrogenase FAD-containing subunit
MDLIIIGGGFCGSLIAKHFDKYKRFNVKLIDKKQYFENSPGIVKLISKPHYHNKLIKLYKDFLKNTTIIKGNFRKITPELVETDKKSYKFDFLVIATGIDYPIFLKNKNNVFTIKTGNDVKKLNSKILNANKILIIGGGLIGIEAAAELVTKFPKKHLTIVHNADRLIERTPPSASNYAKKFLIERGVKIIFNQKVVNHKEKTYITDKNKQINADLALWCAGIKQKTDFMKGFNKDIFSEDQALKVNQFLQLKGHKKIFVGGDITSINEEKTAQNADRHALHIISNINKLIKNNHLQVYKKRITPLVISLGRYDGILIIPPISIPGFIPAIIKWIVEKVSIIRL